jgi:hypothetical protein
MIPEKAIKKFKNDIHREIAAGTLIAYGVFPRGNEGEKEAIDFIATRDEWIAPSDLPEYYNDIDNDLYIGKENDAIRAIRKTLQEFYGITPPSAGTTDFVDTSVPPPATTPKEKVKNKLKPKPYAKDNVDRWSRLTGYELDSLDDYTRDQIRALASKYGVKRYSSYKDKGKLIEAIKDTAGYQQANPQLVDTEIEEIDVSEQVKTSIPKPPQKNVNHPKLPRYEKSIKSFYSNRKKRYILDFESDIDKSLYHIKSSRNHNTGLSRVSSATQGFRFWFSKVTGLDYYENNDEVINYRKKILEYINTGLKTDNIKQIKVGKNIHLIVPPIYDGHFDASYDENEEDSPEEKIEKENDKVVEVRKLFAKNVKHPKLYEELQYIKGSYPIQGELTRLNFRSDIDRAIYFSLKSDKNKSNDIKQRVREWLLEVTGLGFGDPELQQYREEIINVIRTVVKYSIDDEFQKEDYFSIEVPVVYDGYYQDPPDDEEDEEDDDDNEIDPDLASKLDELLKPSDEELQQEDKSIANNITDTIKDVVGEDDDEEDPMANADIDIQAIADGDEDEITDVAGKLTSTINKSKKQSSYTSNKKIFDSITANFGRLQATLDVVNSNLEKQNSLIKASIDSQLAVGELITNQTDMLGEKFDILLQHFERQNDVAEQQQENEKNKLAEGKLEAQRDAAGVSDFKNLFNMGGKSKKRGSKIEEYYKQKALRQLYRVLPKRMRAGIKKARNIRKIPGKIRSKVTSKILSRSPQAVQRLARGAQAIRGAQSAARGAQALRGVRNIGGPARALFAGMEYGERKGQGQSEVQALAGTGGSLAGGTGGAVAGGAVGAGIGALLGGAIGFFFAGVGAAPGALIGAKIGKVAGSLAGGFFGAGKGAEVADSITGADKVTGEYETGAGLTKKGVAKLHGTERVSPAGLSEVSPMNTLGGIMLASTTQFINSAGAVAAPIAPTFKGMAAQMAKQYDVPSTVVQTNIGGSLPSLDKELRKVKEKKQQTPEEELKGIEKDLLETQDPESFADKLLKMLDPEGKFQELLKQINNKSPVGETGEGMATFGESGIDKGTGYNAKGWVHGHFQNSNKQSLVSDTLDVVKKLINSGVSTVITATNKDLTKDMSEDELRRHIEAGVDGHKKYGSGVYAIDVSVPAGTKVPYELENVFDSKGPGGIVGTMKGRTTQIMHLAPGSKAGAAPGTTQVSPGAAPTGDFDVIIPLDHVKPGNENKIPDKKGGNTFENARATGAAGRERQHQDKAAAKVKAKLEAKGLRVKVITPEDFGNYEDYDNYIRAQSTKGTRIVPLHFDAAVGQGGTGFLTRTRAGDSADAAIAKPIQQALSSFQKANPSLGNLGPTDTVSNATINRASAAPAALVEMGSMVAWEKQHGTNFTSTSTFDKLATGISEGIYKGGGFDKRLQPASAQKPRFQSLQGTDNDSDTKYLIVNQQSKPSSMNIRGGGNVGFTEFEPGRWKSTGELDTTMRNLYIQRLGQ